MCTHNGKGNLCWQRDGWFKHFVEPSFREGSTLFFFFLSLELIWNPNSIKWFVKLTHNHWQNCNHSVLEFHPPMREKTTEITAHGTGRCSEPSLAEVPSFLGSDDAFKHSWQRDTLRTYKVMLKSSGAHVQELTQGTLHWLCYILKGCWILRWRITHVIVPATHLSRVSISYLLFLHSKFLDDGNAMSRFGIF